MPGAYHCEPEGVNAVMDYDDWECVDIAVDSGATENVMNDEEISSVETKEGAASRRGVKYKVAYGVQIPNLGERRFEAVTEEGIARGITCQVCRREQDREGGERGGLRQRRLVHRGSTVGREDVAS